MPRISAFYGLVINIYWRDHSPPHFHAEYGDEEAIIVIATDACTPARYRRGRCVSSGSGAVCT